MCILCSATLVTYNKLITLYDASSALLYSVQFVTYIIVVAWVHGPTGQDPLRHRPQRHPRGQRGHRGRGAQKVLLTAESDPRDFVGSGSALKRSGSATLGVQ